MNETEIPPKPQSGIVTYTTLYDGPVHADGKRLLVQCTDLKGVCSGCGKLRTKLIRVARLTDGPVYCAARFYCPRCVHTLSWLLAFVITPRDEGATS